MLTASTDRLPVSISAFSTYSFSVYVDLRYVLDPPGYELLGETSLQDCSSDLPFRRNSRCDSRHGSRSCYAKVPMSAEDGLAIQMKREDHM